MRRLAVALVVLAGAVSCRGDDRPVPVVEPIPVPTLVGGTVADATGAVDRARLRLEVYVTRSPDAVPAASCAAGTVLAQEPVAGSGTVPGSYVTVTVDRC